MVKNSNSFSFVFNTVQLRVEQHHSVFNNHET